MSEIILFHAPRTRSATVRWMLEELGIDYRLNALDLQNGDQKKPALLAVNPMGKVPALKHGDAVITESAAICCYLADAFPDAGLAPPIGDSRRGPYLKWMFFGPSCLEPATLDRFLGRDTGPAASMSYGDFDATLKVVAGALKHSPYLLGEEFSAADVVIGATLEFAAATEVLPADDALTAYLERLRARPAKERARQADEMLAKDMSA